MPPTTTPLVLLLAGSDGFRLTERASALLDSWLPAADRDFALTRVSAKGAEPATLTTAIDTPALFGDRRVVIVDDAEDLSAGVRDALLPLLAGIVSRQDDTVRVLFLHRSSKAVDRQLATHAHLEKFDSMRRADAITWIERAARAKGFTLATGTAVAMVDAIGTDGGRLLQESEKLAGLAQGAITPAHVKHATAVAPPDTPYALYDAVALRETGSAQKTLSSLLRNPDYPGIRILIGLTRHMAQLGVVRARLDRGDSASVVAQSLGYPGRTLVQGAQHWTLAQIDAALDACLDADRELKTSRPDYLTLTTAVAAVLS